MVRKTWEKESRGDNMIILYHKLKLVKECLKGMMKKRKEKKSIGELARDDAFDLQRQLDTSLTGEIPKP